MTMIYQLDADDQELLGRYSEIDAARAGGPVGEIFADENCMTLLDDWREIAERVIARHP